MTSSAHRPTRRRRWHQFSLGAMLVVVTLVAVGMAYWRTMVLRYQSQLVAGDAIVELGGTARYDAALPERLRWLPLADHCKRVVAVDLEGCRFAAGSLEPLSELPDLRVLVLANSSVTDEDLEHVGTLSKLQILSLWRTQITNNGLSHLTGLNALQKIDVHANPNMDERSLDFIRHWPNLRLVKHDFPVTDRGLAALAAHPNVPVQSLRICRMSDLGITNLQQLRQLRQLTLLGLIDLPINDVRVSLPKLSRVEVHCGPIPSFGELADHWCDDTRELEIGGHSWDRSNHFDREPVQTDINMRGPLIAVGAVVINRMNWEAVRQFEKVEMVTIEGHGFDPACLKYLQELSRLKRLRLNVAVSNELMLYLAQIPRLERLDLSGAYEMQRFQLDPDACDSLKALVNLQTFTAVVTGMNDRDLTFLTKCPQLRRVYLWDLIASRETLANLSTLPSLEELLFFNCHQFHNDDLELLHRFKSLRVCWINGKHIDRNQLDSVLDSIPTVDMDPQRRQMYRDTNVKFDHHVLWRLPDL